MVRDIFHVPGLVPLAKTVRLWFPVASRNYGDSALDAVHNPAMVLMDRFPFRTVSARGCLAQLLGLSECPA
jgi:hypothetical protein